MRIKAIAMLSQDDFETARAAVAELREHQHYDDWVDSRYGRLMGLAFAGVEAQLVDVALAGFLRWCDEAGAAPSEAGLDDFAAQTAGRGQSVAAWPESIALEV
jgi:hypothetical protein